MIHFRRSRTKLRILLGKLTGQPREVLLRHRFNLCAEQWAGNLESPHKLIAEKALQRMRIGATDQILDLACGDGWVTRMMAGLAGENSLVVGLDISDGMVRRARANSGRFRNLRFICGSAEHIPSQDNFFTKVLSIEAFYYFEHQEQVLRELFRVTAPLGQLFLILCLYRDYPDGLVDLDELSVPVHVRSAADYRKMLQSTGWAEVQTEEYVRQPEPGRKPNAHDRALFISARKPNL